MRENWEMLDKILLAIRDEFEQNNEALRRESMAGADANRELTRLRAENERLRVQLEFCYKLAKSWIESELEGTSMLQQNLNNLEPARHLLAALGAEHE